jgi:cellulose biosynthesis protein BcsQ
MALANIGALLCKWGHKVLCVDWDLEAPGLHLYFDHWIVTPDRPGLTELVQAHTDGENPEWRNFLTEVEFPGANQSLSLLTAGRQDESYVPRVQALDWADLYEKHDLGGFLEKLRGEWKESFDFILIDSRTGITDTSGICTVQLPDFMVLLFTANLQSLKGSITVVDRARKARDRFPYDRAGLMILPVATRFESRIEYETAQRWLKTFATELSPIYSQWIHRDIETEDLLNHTRVPYIPYWSFGERLPVIEKGTDDPEDIGFSFETLAAVIAQKFANSDLLVSNRDSFVTLVNRSVAPNGSRSARGGRSGNAIEVFVSYSSKDEAFRDQLEMHLKPLERQGIIEIWDYLQEASGESWSYEVDRNLEDADVILLLVSSDYLASPNCYDVEMRRALQRHESGEVVIVPVILRPVNWNGSPMANLQVLPRDGKPMTAWPNVDEPLAQVAQKVQELANAIIRSKGLSRTPVPLHSLNPSSVAGT